MFTRRIPLTNRFLAKFERGNADECWLWNGAPNGEGYGTIGEGGRNGKTLQAHRVSFLFHNGFLPVGFDICHSCDVRMCVNPKHLFYGTHADNNRDRDLKGRCRAAGKPGEGCGHAKLKNSQVISIHSDNRPSAVIAAELGVSRTTIANIKLGKTWKHLRTLNLWDDSK